MSFDPTGKVILDDVYLHPDPRAYFSTLRKLDYCIPQVAKPYFARLIQEYMESQRLQAANVLDIGCSYGVNAALLRCDATMDDLYDRYCGGDADISAPAALLSRDRKFVRSGEHMPGIRFVGLDTSDNALSYAMSAGFIDAAVHANLEESELTEPQREHLAAVDVAISTGCFGYITEKTISQIVSAQEGRKPWMAHFVLRMFSFERAAESLAKSGYDTARAVGLFRQRRFSSLEEQSLVLDTLSSMGVDPRGLETDGWLYAHLYVSRPSRSKGSAVVPDHATSTEDTVPVRSTGLPRRGRTRT